MAAMGVAFNLHDRASNFCSANAVDIVVPWQTARCGFSRDPRSQAAKVQLA